MPRLAFKPDASFFRKIAIGAIGARAVVTDLADHGHVMIELERGSTDTKLWKDVKRKRVRIPDLVCRQCGLRVESRAKTKPSISVSHSPTDLARAWDFGMVDSDIIALPVCAAAEEDYWSRGDMEGFRSEWREKNWVKWSVRPAINYLQTANLRSSRPTRSSTKGVTEGSETSIEWEATFSTRDGRVEDADDSSIAIRRAHDGHLYRWRVSRTQLIRVNVGDDVRDNQLIASSVPPYSVAKCGGDLPTGHLINLLSSRERTQRFTGLKLARVRNDAGLKDLANNICSDVEEDVYVRLEAAAYLASTCDYDVSRLFTPFLDASDQQTQLEAVICLGETDTSESLKLLVALLEDESAPFFLRSAAAWCLSRGRSCSERAADALVRAFRDLDVNLRDEALNSIKALGDLARPALLAGIQAADNDMAAGCAEALRKLYWSGQEPEVLTADLARIVPESDWAVWLSGQLPRDMMAARVASLQQSAPHLHYAITLLWSFRESWIANRWECDGARRASKDADTRDCGFDPL